jgi:hypothetical protein
MKKNTLCSTKLTTSFFNPLREYVNDELGMSGGEMFAYHSTGGSNLDMDDECFDSNGNAFLVRNFLLPT